MNRLEYLQKIEKWFSFLILHICSSNARGSFDINGVAEDFYVPILKKLFGSPSLKNQNIIKHNFPAIDLGCEKSKISFQLTSENGSAKIVHTLEKFRENNLDKKYDELYILIITKKQKSYSSHKLEKEIKNQKISFDKDKHVIDYRDIIKKISELEDTNEIKVIYQILEKEFVKQEKFSICRDELDNLLEISNNKIEVEKKTKKYIPSIFTEPTKTKDLARLFVNPLFFYRKVEDKLLGFNYEDLNEFLSMMGIDSISSSIHEYIESNTPTSLVDTYDYMEELKRKILNEKEKIEPFNPWGKTETRPDFDVPVGKEALKSLLKHKRESLCYGLDRKYDDALEFIDICLSKIFLITSMAGQGKTNFVCDLIENQFKLFDIPSVFIPARELNSCDSPLIFKFLIKNRYLAKMSDQYELLDFFDGVAKEIEKPFVIVIDGINEVKDLELFNSEISDFLNAVDQFDFVKVIMTCRNEFFEQKFSTVLKQPFSEKIYHVKDLKADMSEENLERILESYIEHFEIEASLSETASDFLKSDLLLLRIFCELNQKKKIGNIDEIYKDQLYEKYLINRIEGFDKKLRKIVLPTLYSIAQEMIANDEYSSLILDKSFHEDQFLIVEQLVSEDIVLRREVSEKNLETTGIETIGFTYDELRDFIIAHYLINQLAIQDFAEFEKFFLKLPSLQIYEGVFKYIYILSKKDDRKNIIDLCESVDSFDDHYSIILWSLSPEYQSKEDIEKVQDILRSNDSKSAVHSIAFYLFKHRQKTHLLNISILTDVLNSLEDKEFTVRDFFKLFANRFNSYFSSESVNF